MLLTEIERVNHKKKTRDNVEGGGGRDLFLGMGILIPRPRGRLNGWDLERQHQIRFVPREMPRAARQLWGVARCEHSRPSHVADSRSPISKLLCL